MLCLMKRPLPLLSSCQQQAGCQTKCSQHGRALLGDGVLPQGLGAGLQVVTGVGAGMKLLDYSSQIWLDPSSCLHGLGWIRKHCDSHRFNANNSTCCQERFVQAADLSGFKSGGSRL